MIEIVEELARRYGDDHAEYFRNKALAEATSGDQTPIENRMALALHYAVGSPHQFHDYRRSWFIESRLTLPAVISLAKAKSGPGFLIAPQTKIGRFTADFVVSSQDHLGGTCFGAIECDGHAYHDLTKEQARHDRARDRFFQEEGLLILRFTGSEIVQDPVKCAVSALSILDNTLFKREKINGD